VQPAVKILDSHYRFQLVCRIIDESPFALEGGAEPGDKRFKCKSE